MGAAGDGDGANVAALADHVECDLTFDADMITPARSKPKRGEFRIAYPGGRRGACSAHAVRYIG